MTADAFHSPERVTAIRDRVKNAKGIDLGSFIAVLLVVDVFIVGAVVGALAPHALWWVALLALAGPFLAFWLIHVAAWGPWQRAFPAQPQSRDALVKHGQSATLGALARMNNCITIAADEDHLHLIPFAAMRVVGAKVISLPWSGFEDVAPAKGAITQLVSARIGGRRFSAPEWAMRLARVEPVAESDAQAAAH